VRLIASAGHLSGGGDATTLDPRSAFADLTVVVFDVCQNTVVSMAYGHESTVPESAFSFTGDGPMSATLSKPVTICDRSLEIFECLPGSARSVAINVAWIGIGDVSRFHAPVVPNIAPSIFVQISGSTSAARAAELTGTIADGATNFAADVIGQGFVARFTAISLTVVMP